MRHEYRSIPLDQIDVPEDRMRTAKMDRVHVLSADIKANGQLQPIGVAEEENGRFALVFGLHRLMAVKMAGRAEIDARVQPQATPQQRRVDEIMENLDREGLTKLERAESLAALKAVHEELYPEAKHGGDRKSAKRKNQKEIFSFRSDAAEKTGLSLRAINMAVELVAKLDGDAKARLRGSWLEDHQASLVTLAKFNGKMQHEVLDRLLATPPEAESVADAKLLVEGERLKTPKEKRLNAAIGTVKRLPDDDFRHLVKHLEPAIRRIALEEGWFK